MQRGIPASLEIVNFVIENVVANDAALMIVDLQASRCVVKKGQIFNLSIAMSECSEHDAAGGSYRIAFVSVQVQ